MHAVHTTEGLILSERDFGEASRIYDILTPDWGLVAARAQGARELRSKLRGHLIPLARLRVSLVRGREVWHLVGAEREGTWFLAGADGAQRSLAYRVAGLVRRFSPEAAADPELFAALLDGLRQLTNWPAADLARQEVVWVWRLLAILGYIEDVSRGAAMPEPVAESAVLIRQINRALTHSHL